MFSSIATYQPREGPETHRTPVTLCHTLISCIAPYLPREGPETCRINNSAISHRICIAPYQPREGPETPRKTLPYLTFFRIDTYLPREGAETRQTL